MKELLVIGLIVVVAIGCAPRQIELPVDQIGDITKQSHAVLEKITAVLAQSDISSGEKAQLISAFRESFDKFVTQTVELVRFYLAITRDRQESSANNKVNLLLQILGIATSSVLIGKNVELTPHEYRELGLDVLEMHSRIDVYRAE